MAKGDKTIIGKDVIESLTLGMYDDSRYIYREYIQNSADQIDKAVEMGILENREDGVIDIKIDWNEGEISIYDNATGIRSEEVSDILRNIAQSGKDRTKDKGFRGIGRLGGLGYCKKLVFETSYKGENTKSILIWDAQLLKNIINDRSKKEEAADVIDQVTSYETQPENKEEHYFKVVMQGVTNKMLLSKRDIITYLSMVAPVPYNKGFIFRNQIHDELTKHGLTLDEYVVYVNTDQVFKAYTTTIYEGEENSKKRIDDIKELQFFTVLGKDKSLLGWGWYGISNFVKQIPARGNIARGMRLRKGNIQIGSDNCLVKLFRESRGSFYFFGEVHAFDKDLIPNARRDYFLENNTMIQFENSLKNTFQNELHQLYYFASKIRNAQKHIESLVVFKEELQVKQAKGFTDNNEKQQLEERFDDLKEKAKEAEKEIAKISTQLSEKKESPKSKIFQSVVGKEKVDIDTIELPEIEEGSKTKYVTDDLTSLNRKERKMVSKIFSVIDKVLPRELAENLKEKIKEDFV